ncbi:hypothetical protein [uncultured Nocardioides sp.]|uniref:hypothetical protein n=1 Tax=uncultured Nocardioides sp. TaxID=198441 RepID=UPI002613F969|nr:hypothetical protein [uncultured Nocardioides sp.]
MSTRYRSTPARRPTAERHGQQARPGGLNPLAWLALPLVFVVIAAGAAFWQHQDAADAEAPHAGCVVAVDPQGSTKAMAATYRSWLGPQVQRCAAASRASVDLVLVTSETTTTSTTPVHTDLSALELTGNAPTDRRLVAEEIDRVVDEAGVTLFEAPKQKSLGTDLIGIACVAADLLAGATEKTLILNTDAMNDRRPYQLRALPLDEASIARLVDSIRDEGRICDLAGVQVQIYGAGIGAGTARLSPAQLAGVRRFWEAFFEAAGADLVAYRRNP